MTTPPRQPGPGGPERKGGSLPPENPTGQTKRPDVPPSLPARRTGIHQEPTVTISATPPTHHSGRTQHSADLPETNPTVSTPPTDAPSPTEQGKPDPAHQSSASSTAEREPTRSPFAEAVATILGPTQRVDTPTGDRRYAEVSRGTFKAEVSAETHDATKTTSPSHSIKVTFDDPTTGQRGAVLLSTTGKEHEAKTLIVDDQHPDGRRMTLPEIENLGTNLQDAYNKPEPSPSTTPRNDHFTDPSPRSDNVPPLFQTDYFGHLGDFFAESPTSTATGDPSTASVNFGAPKTDHSSTAEPMSTERSSQPTSGTVYEGTSERNPQWVRRDYPSTSSPARPRSTSAATQVGESHNIYTRKSLSPDKLTIKNVIKELLTMGAASIATPFLLLRVKNIEKLGNGKVRVTIKKNGKKIAIMLPRFDGGIIDKIRAVWKTH